MHEVNKEAHTLESMGVLLQDLVDTNMGIMIQLSRLYDLEAARAVGLTKKEVLDIIQNHEHGDIYSVEPRLRSFGEAEDASPQVTDE